jgi:hypothetical protein
MEKQVAKKKLAISLSVISNFFMAIDPFKNDNVHH